MAKSQRPAPLNEHTWAQASEWLLRFSEEEVDAATREQFNDWLRNSPENVHAYLQVSAFWQAADQMGRQSDGSRDIEALVECARREAKVYPLANVYLERDPPPDLETDAGTNVDVVPATAGLWSRRSFRTAAALLVLAVGVGAAIAYKQSRDPIYQTGIGEQRILNLPDGSTVTLNADSRLEVRFSDTERGIELSEGQALFKVARNAARPFVVRSGGTSVRAVGTQFDVNKKKTGTVVTVVEGKVAVTSSPRTEMPDMLMTAGQQVTVSAAPPRAHRPTESPLPPPVIHAVKLENATAWTEGLLVFEAAPLDEVVQEFNRHNARPLVLEGDGLISVKITGTFPADGSERITRFLQERHDVVGP